MKSSPQTSTSATPPDQKTASPTLDLAFSACLVLASVFLAAYSVRLSAPYVQREVATFYTAPGFMLLVVSLLLFALSASQTLALFRARTSACSSHLEDMAPHHRSRRLLSTVLTLLYLWLYMCAFWGTVPGTELRVPFWLSTFCFLVAMMTTFRATSLKRVLLISVLFAGLVDACFRYLVKVPLP
jgi:hypothetical protein